ncbi:MAG: CysS/YqeB C-terminal domain-containing protein [Ilumatobacteraceae bacterium]
MTLPRMLAIMGSGETAPTMVSTHRRLTSLLPSPVRAVVLDTPYGFQENAPELAERAVDYFSTSVNVDLLVAGLTRMQPDERGISPDAVSVEKGLRMVDDADYVFAGPGSPTYSLRQWSNTPLRSLLIRKLHTGGVVTFASAAALTLGRRTVPVYEIYKAGSDPYWLEGLDVLGEFGISATVIPHYDNAEGGHHDTRFCYLGERRLQMLEERFESDEYVIGIDEHTGLVLDFDRDVAEVVGNSTVTLRNKSQEQKFETGDVIPLDQLRTPSWSGTSASTPAPSRNAARSDTTHGVAASSDTGPVSLGAAADQHRATFDSAIARRDADAAVGAILALESDIRAWSVDTLQSADRDLAVAALRSMISKLGEAATGGLRDPRSVVEPFVGGLLAVRSVARAEKRFDLSDLVRDQLLAAGVEVRDTKDGVEWVLRTD